MKGRHRTTSRDQRGRTGYCVPCTRRPNHLRDRACGPSIPTPVSSSRGAAPHRCGRPKGTSHSRASRSARVTRSVGMSYRTHAIHVAMDIVHAPKMIPDRRDHSSGHVSPRGLRTKFAALFLLVSYPIFPLVRPLTPGRRRSTSVEGCHCETHPSTRLYAKDVSSPRAV
jgi:hypothetical protein